MPSRLNACPTNPGANPAPLRSVPVLLPTASPASPLARHQAAIPAGGAAHGPGAGSDSVTDTGRLSPGGPAGGVTSRRGAGATLPVTPADRTPPAVAVIVVAPPFRITPSTDAVPWVVPSGIRTLALDLPFTVATSGWKGMSVTLTPPGGAGTDRVTVSIALCSARTSSGDGASDSDGCTTWNSTALETCARDGLAASGFTTRTGSAPRVARSAASRVACRRAGLVKVVARLEPLYWTTDSGMNPAPSTVRRAPALPRIPAFGVMNERTGTGTVTVNATGPDAALPSGVTTVNARGPAGADGSMVIRARTFVAVATARARPRLPRPAPPTSLMC